MMQTANTYYQIFDRPLTSLMVEGLMDCHERELLNLEPNEASKFSSTSGLALRGMVETRWYTKKDGKRILAVYVTKRGKWFLNQI